MATLHRRCEVDRCCYYGVGIRPGGGRREGNGSAGRVGQNVDDDEVGSRGDRGRLFSSVTAFSILTQLVE